MSEEKDISELISQRNPNAVRALEIKAEMDAAIVTAKQYPRDPELCVQQMHALATIDLETAESMWYDLPVGREKTIQDASIRAAEVIFSCWGNIHGASRALGVDDSGKFVEAEGIVKDLEKNSTITRRVKAPITYKNGDVFDDHMIGVTQAASCAKAFRNAVFSVIPKALARKVMNNAMDMVRKTADLDIKESRKKVIEKFAEINVKPQRVAEFIGVPSIDKIDAIHIVKLRGIFTSIKEGYMDKDYYFGEKKMNRRSTENSFDISEDSNKVIDERNQDD